MDDTHAAQYSFNTSFILFTKHYAALSLPGMSHKFTAVYAAPSFHDKHVDPTYCDYDTLLF